MAAIVSSAWGSAAWGAAPWGGGLPFATSGTQTADPAHAASRRSIGSVFITPPGIGPAAAVSRRHIPGSVAIGGGTVTMGIGFAPTRRALGVPNLAGPVHPDAAISRRFVGTPFINAISSVSPAAATSRRSVSNVRVDIVQSIAPDAAASRRSVGSVTMTGGPNPIKIYPAPSRRACGVVAISGGSTQLVVNIGGAPWGGTVLSQGGSDTAAPASYESSNPPTITSQTLGRWVLNVDLFDDSGLYAPAVGQTIQVMEGGYLLFAGCIQTIAYARLMGTVKSLIYHVTATDKSGICDRRIVPVITFPAGSDVAQSILSIVQNNLDGEGILTTPQSVPQDGSLGSLAADLTLNYDTVTDAFNQLGTLSGTIWYVDPQGILWFNSFNSLPSAPWGLGDPETDPLIEKNYRSLLVQPTNIDYANEIFVVSNLTVLPGSGSDAGGGAGTATGTNTETYAMTVGNIGVITMPDGTTIIGVQTAQPIGTLYSITVNGEVQTVVEISQWSGQEPSFGTDDFGPWFWTSNGQRVLLSVLSGAAFPIAGATLVINYTPFTTNAQASVGEALTPVDPATGGTLGTCGSGRYQLAVQVQNVSSVDSLNAIAVAELAKRGGAQVQITFQTDKPGLLPGQVLNVNIPNLYLVNVPFLITYMQGIAAAGPLEFGSRFQWEVRAVTNEDPGNWIQWYANVLGQAANALPVPDYEDADFVLAPGSSLAGGNVATNPYPVKQTGKLLVMIASAGIPPTDEDLNIFFFVNGNRIPGQVTIPAGSTANSVYVYPLPSTNPLYVFNTATANDVITVGVSYTVTGASPTPASNVSATLRWTM